MACRTCGGKKKKRKRIAPVPVSGDWVRLTTTFNQYSEGSEGEILSSLLGGIAHVAFIWGTEMIPVSYLEKIER